LVNKPHTILVPGISGYNHHLVSCTWSQMIWFEWFLTEVTLSTDRFSICTEKDLEHVLRGAILVPVIFPVIFVYKLLALRIIYILIRSAQLPSTEKVKQLTHFLLVGFWGNSWGRLAEPLNQNKVTCRRAKPCSPSPPFFLLHWGIGDPEISLSLWQSN
jgi:hypothetical protein